MTNTACNYPIRAGLTRNPVETVRHEMDSNLRRPERSALTTTLPKHL